MSSTRFLALGLVVLASLAPACASEIAESETTEDAVVGGAAVDRTHKSFAGSFALDDGGMSAKFEFKVTNIDWTALTAKWSAKVVDSAGDAVSDDVNDAVKISLMRCPGCYTFQATNSAGEALAVLTFSASKLTQLTYASLRTANAKITSASTSPTGSTADAQSCALTCEGEMLDCKDGTTQAACKPALFSSLPRCLYEVTHERKSCAERRAPAVPTGSCAIVCGTTVFACKNDIVETNCKLDIFSSRPRCPSVMKFESGAICD